MLAGVNCFSNARKIGAIFIKLGRAPTIHAIRSFLVIELEMNKCVLFWN
jgi:hypothetical protein